MKPQKNNKSDESTYPPYENKCSEEVLRSILDQLRFSLDQMSQILRKSSSYDFDDF